MHAYTDASRVAHGVVLYIEKVESGKICYLTAHNKLLNESMKGKSIPTLELQGICFGVEMLHETCEALRGSTVVCPINISSLNLFTDIMVCLHWL